MATPQNDDQPRWQRLLWIGLPILAIVVVVFLVISRQDDDETNVSIEGVEWQLAELRVDGALAPAIPDSSASLLLDSGDASGSGGCNSFNGGYALDGASLTFTPLASTLRLCNDPPGIDNQESTYFALLSGVDEQAVVDDQLVLSSDGAEVLVFNAG